jgi:hypothetical protein
MTSEETAARARPDPPHFVGIDVAALEGVVRLIKVERAVLLAQIKNGRDPGRAVSRRVEVLVVLSHSGGRSGQLFRSG